MNMQNRSDRRSIALHKEIAKKLRNDPSLWVVPKRNIERWKKVQGRLIPALIEWENVLQETSKDQILSIIENDSEESARLRSSSPFTGILNESERERIFKLYSINNSIKVESS